MGRLWESDHPYYCSSGCYFAPARECHQSYDSWASFVEDWAESDADYNLLFRWDWKEGDDEEVPPGRARLCLYYMLQRKAYPISVEVSLARDDEPAVREWLTAKWRHMRKLWSPLDGAP